VVRESLKSGPGLEASDPEWTVRRILDWTTRYLRRGGVEAARFEAETLLAHALSTERLELYLHPDRTLSPKERARFRTLIKRRRAGTPLAYLLGTVEFMNTMLKVDESVLIPRAETEELVEQILKDLGPVHPGLRLLDLGTGSGAIAIALLVEWPEARALAVDISHRALKLARENARLNGVIERIDFVCCHWLSAISGGFDLVVSNPPYVPTEEFAALPKEVRAEPREALDGGPRGLREIERIVREVPSFLREGGRLYLEIGAGQVDDVRALLWETKAFSQVDALCDLAGRARIVRALRTRGR
jgi:release factor glutamine methyltransferase